MKDLCLNPHQELISTETRERPHLVCSNTLEHIQCTHISTWCGPPSSCIQMLSAAVSVAETSVKELY